MSEEQNNEFDKIVDHTPSLAQQEAVAEKWVKIVNRLLTPIAIVLVGFVIYGFYSEAQERAAAELNGEALAKLDAAFADQQDLQLAQRNPEEFDKLMQQQLTSLTAVEQEFTGQEVGQSALYYIAVTQLELKKYADAQASLSKYLQSTIAEPQATLANIALGNAILAQLTNENAESSLVAAGAAYQKAANGKSLLAQNARFNYALTLACLGKRAEAESIIAQIKADQVEDMMLTRKVDSLERALLVSTDEQLKAIALEKVAENTAEKATE